MGAQDREGREDGRAAGVHRRPSPASSPWRCSSTPPASRTAAWSTAVEKLFSCTVPTEESAARRSRVHRWSCCTGARSPASRRSSPRSARSTRCSPPTASRSAPCAAVALEEMPNEPWRQNPTSGSDSVRRSTPIVEGDSLASVAFAEYGDPRPWRDVARFNGIDDPLRCRCPAPGSCSRPPRSSERCRITNTFLVEIDGTALPADIAPLLIAALVDDSQKFPDLFELRFRDPAPPGAPEVRGEGRLRGEDLRARPVTARPRSR